MPLTEIVSLDEARDHLNIDTVDNGELQGFIAAAAAYIQHLAGPILSTSFTEEHNGGSSTVILRNPPVLSIASVTEYVGQTGYVLTRVSLGDVIGQYSYSLDSAKSGILRRRFNGGVVGCFASGERNVVVAYTAGLDAVPADLRMAVLQDIAGLYQPSQLGTNPYGNDAALGNAPLNPVGMFPRVAEILSAPAKRTPAIA